MLFSIKHPKVLAVPLLKEGDKLLCENGHVVCKVLRDIHIGESMRRETLKFTKKQPPQEGKGRIKGCFCGSDWIKGGTNLGYLPTNIRRK